MPILWRPGVGLVKQSEGDRGWAWLERRCWARRWHDGLQRNGLVRPSGADLREVISQHPPVAPALCSGIVVVFSPSQAATEALQIAGGGAAKVGALSAWFAEVVLAGPQLVNGICKLPGVLGPSSPPLLTALITTPVAFVAEVVRGGIAAVPAASGSRATYLGLANWSSEACARWCCPRRLPVDHIPAQ